MNVFHIHPIILRPYYMTLSEGDALRPLGMLKRRSASTNLLVAPPRSADLQYCCWWWWRQWWWW